MNRRTLTTAIVMAILCAAAVLTGAPAAMALNSAVPLGAGGYGAIVVDDAHAHVFISTPQANAVRVFDFDGNPVTTIQNLPGAKGLLINGSTLYVAEQDVGAIE